MSEPADSAAASTQPTAEEDPSAQALEAASQTAADLGKAFASGKKYQAVSQAAAALLEHLDALTEIHGEVCPRCWRRPQTEGSSDCECEAGRLSLESSLLVWEVWTKALGSEENPLDEWLCRFAQAQVDAERNLEEDKDSPGYHPLRPYSAAAEQALQRVLRVCRRLLDLRSQRGPSLVQRLRAPFDHYEEYQDGEKWPSRRRWELAPWIQAPILELLATCTSGLEGLDLPSLRKGKKATRLFEVTGPGDATKGPRAPVLSGELVERLVTWIDMTPPPRDSKRGMYSLKRDEEWERHTEHLCSADLHLSALRILAVVDVPEDEKLPSNQRVRNANVSACLVRAYAGRYPGEAAHTSKRLDFIARRKAALAAFVARARRAAQAAERTGGATQQVAQAIARSFDARRSASTPADVRHSLDRLLHRSFSGQSGSSAARASCAQELRLALEAVLPPAVLCEGHDDLGKWYSTKLEPETRHLLALHLSARAPGLFATQLKHLVLARGDEKGTEEAVAKIYAFHAARDGGSSGWSNLVRSEFNTPEHFHEASFALARRFRLAALREAVALSHNPVAVSRLAGYRLLVWTRPVHALPHILRGIDDTNASVRELVTDFVRRNLNGDDDAGLRSFDGAKAIGKVFNGGLRRSRKVAGHDGRKLGRSALRVPRPTSTASPRKLEELSQYRCLTETVALRGELVSLINDPLLDPFDIPPSAVGSSNTDGLGQPRGERAFQPRYEGEDLLPKELTEHPTPDERKLLPAANWTDEQVLRMARFERQTAALRYVIRASRYSLETKGEGTLPLTPDASERDVLLFALRHPDPDVFAWAREQICPGKAPRKPEGSWPRLDAELFHAMSDSPAQAERLARALHLRLEALCSLWHGRSRSASVTSTARWCLYFLWAVEGDRCRPFMERLAADRDILTPWAKESSAALDCWLDALRFVADTLRPPAFVRFVLGEELLTRDCGRWEQAPQIVDLIAREAKEGTLREQAQVLVVLEAVLQAESRSSYGPDDVLVGNLGDAKKSFKEDAGLSDDLANALSLVENTQSHLLRQKSDAEVERILTRLRDEELARLLGALEGQEAASEAALAPYPALLRRIVAGKCSAGTPRCRAEIVWDWLLRTGVPNEGQAAGRASKQEASSDPGPIRRAALGLLSLFGAAAAQEEDAEPAIRDTYDALEKLLSPENREGTGAEANEVYVVHRARREKRWIAQGLLHALEATQDKSAPADRSASRAAGDLLLEFALEPRVVGTALAERASLPLARFLGSDPGASIRQEALDEFHERWVKLDGAFFQRTRGGALKAMPTIPAGTKLGDPQGPASLDEGFVVSLERAKGPLAAFAELGPWSSALTLSGCEALRTEAALFRTAQLRLYWHWFHTVRKPLPKDLFTKRHEYHLDLELHLQKGEVDLYSESEARFEKRLHSYKRGLWHFVSEVCEVADAVGAFLDDELIQLTLLDLCAGDLSREGQADVSWWTTNDARRGKISATRKDEDEEKDGIELLGEVIHQAYEVEGGRARLCSMDLRYGLGVGAGPRHSMPRWKAFRSHLEEDLALLEASTRLQVAVTSQPPHDRSTYPTRVLRWGEGLNVTFMCENESPGDEEGQLQLRELASSHLDQMFVTFEQRGSGGFVRGHNLRVVRKGGATSRGSGRSPEVQWANLEPGEKVQMGPYELTLQRPPSAESADWYYAQPSRQPLFALIMDGKLPALNRAGTRFARLVAWRPLEDRVTLCDVVGTLEKVAPPSVKQDTPGKVLFKLSTAAFDVQAKTHEVLSGLEIKDFKGMEAQAKAKNLRSERNLYALGRSRARVLALGISPARGKRILIRAETIEGELRRGALLERAQRAKLDNAQRRSASVTRAVNAAQTVAGLVAFAKAWDEFGDDPAWQHDALALGSATLALLDAARKSKTAQAAMKAKTPRMGRALKSGKVLGPAASLMSTTLAVWDFTRHEEASEAYREYATHLSKQPDATFARYEHVTQRQLRGRMMRDVLDGCAGVLCTIAPFTGPAAPFIELAGLCVALASAAWNTYDTLYPPDLAEKLADFLGYDYFRHVDAGIDAALDSAKRSSVAGIGYHLLVGDLDCPGTMPEGACPALPSLIVVLGQPDA